MKENMPDCCLLCRDESINELDYGELFHNSKEQITVHHYCLLFAPGLPQLGYENTESIEGFLFKDIKKEVKRVSRLKCSFCKKTGANLGCCIKTCEYAYHTACGLSNNVRFEFTSKFKTFCKKHKKINQTDKKNLDSKCGICFENLVKKYPHAILAPCCENSWFHKICLQKFALSSAAFFKCPLCGDQNIQKLNELGIYIPYKEPSWETEENAFQEFNEPIKLSCEDEQCKNKTQHSKEIYMWRLCQFCGAEGIHEKCFTGSENDKYTCKSCSEIVNKSKESKKCKKKKPKSIAAIMLGESDVSSDDESWNVVARVIVEKPRSPPKKPKSIAAIMLGESDASSEDESWIVNYLTNKKT